MKEVKAIERRVSFTVRVPESVARLFKSKCALEGVTGQEVLERAMMRFLEDKNKKPE